MKIVTFSTWDLQEQCCKSYVASYQANEHMSGLMGGAPADYVNIILSIMFGWKHNASMEVVNKIDHHALGDCKDCDRVIGLAFFAGPYSGSYS